jgi:PAS domain S-box-containing protein
MKDEDKTKAGLIKELKFLRVEQEKEVFKDIAEYKQAKEELEKLAKFPAENPYPVLRISKDGIVLYHNYSSESLLRYWHYQEGKPLQDSLFQFVLGALRDDDIKTVETEMGDKVIFLTFAPIIGKDFVNVYGLDITERKKNEEELRLHVAMMNNIAEGICLVGLDDLLIRWTNDRFAKIFGYEPGEMVGKHVDILNAPTEKTPSETRRSLVDTLKETGEWHGEIKNIKRDGTPFWCYASVSLFDHPEYGKVGVSVHTDITERKQAQEALQEAHDQLENQVAQRTEELEDANLKLQEIDQLKSMFIASMSHELRTPLNFITGFTDIILQEISGEINQEQRKQLLLVKNSASHLSSLINDLIDINKIETGIVQITVEKFDLSALSREIKDDFRIVADKKELVLSLEVPPTLLIKGEERRTKQILVNLISNALKFTDKGEIKIKIVKKDKIVEISVRDTGIGIRRREDMDKLFKPFSQINRLDKIREGTGLGLYLSKKNANLLGGDIMAESEFGKGSIFTLSLPLKYKKTKG